MRLRLLLVDLVILVLLILVSGYFYFFSGLQEYVAAVIMVRRLPQTQATQVWTNYFATTDRNFYSGILGGVWQDRIWLWGDRGLRGFKRDSNTVYTFYSACTQDILAKGVVEKRKLNIEPTISTDFAAWRSKIKRGDYITIALTREGGIGTPGNAREVYSYDWWIFIPNLNLQKSCLK